MDLTFLLNLVRSGKDLSCLLDTSGRPVSFESSHQAGPPTLRPNPPVNVAPGFVMCSPKLMQDSPVMIVIKHLTSKKGFAVMKECQANMFNIFYMALFSFSVSGSKLAFGRLWASPSLDCSTKFLCCYQPNLPPELAG